MIWSTEIGFLLILEQEKNNTFFTSMPLVWQCIMLNKRVQWLPPLTTVVMSLIPSQIHTHMTNHRPSHALPHTSVLCHWQLTCCDIWPVFDCSGDSQCYLVLIEFDQIAALSKCERKARDITLIWFDIIQPRVNVHVFYKIIIFQTTSLDLNFDFDYVGKLWTDLKIVFFLLS